MTTHPDIPTDDLERLAAQITPDWCIYSELDVGLPPTLFAGIPGESGFGPIEPLLGHDLTLASIAPALLRELIARRKADEWQPTHRHVKRGTEYREVARGKLQTDTPLTDYAELVAYHDHDGNWWFRAPSEFDDGRFTTLTAGDSHDD